MSELQSAALGSYDDLKDVNATRPCTRPHGGTASDSLISSFSQRDLMGILDDCYTVRFTIVTNQYPMDK